MTENAPRVAGAAPPASLWSRFLLVLVVTGTLIKAVLDSRSGLEVIDLWYLSETGAELFGGGWADVFSDPGIQVGPLLLLIQGALWELAALTRIRLELLFGVAVQVTAAVACMGMIAIGPSRGAAKRWEAAVLGGILLTLWELPWGAYVFGHPSEFFIPLLWLAAARSARDGRGGLGGVLVGLSGALKAWGLLGLPVVLLAPRVRWPNGFLSAGVVTLISYGPFFIFGEVATFDYEWSVRDGAGATLFLPVGEDFGWPLRFGQGLLSVVVGAAVALWVRRKEHAFVWAPPLAVVATRLAVDPTAFSYYWLAPQAILLVGAGWSLVRRQVGRPLLLVGLAAASFLVPLVPVSVVALVMLTTAVVVSLVEPVPSGSSPKFFGSNGHG